MWQLIVFRTNAGPNIGYGHLFRCIALAKAIKKKSEILEIIFIINKAAVEIVKKYYYQYIVSENFNDIQMIKTLKPEAIIFDSYLANNNYLNDLSQVTKLVIFDDNNDIYNSKIPKLVINGNIHAKSLDYKSEALLGPKYLVMRSEYWDVKINNPSEKNICITTGGSDFNNLMPKFVKSLNILQFDKKFIIGPGFNNKEIEEIELIKREKDQLIYKPSTLIDIFNKSTIILTACGTSIYEILRLNKIPIIYTLADNQEKIAKKIEEYGIVNLGNYNNLDYNSLGNIVDEQIRKTEKKKNELKELFRIFDGQGSLRVAKYILEKVI